MVQTTAAIAMRLPGHGPARLGQDRNVSTRALASRPRTRDVSCPVPSGSLGDTLWTDRGKMVERRHLLRVAGDVAARAAERDPPHVSVEPIPGALADRVVADEESPATAGTSALVEQAT